MCTFLVSHISFNGKNSVLSKRENNFNLVQLLTFNFSWSLMLTDPPPPKVNGTFRLITYHAVGAYFPLSQLEANGHTVRGGKCVMFYFHYSLFLSPIRSSLSGKKLLRREQILPI